MYKVDYFLAAPVAYKEIWLTRILEASIRGHVKKDLIVMVKELCNIYSFNYNKINKRAIENYNRKANFRLYVSNTILGIRFRYYYLIWKFSNILCVFDNDKQNL